MYSVAVVEDDKNDAEALQNAIGRYESETHEKFTVTRFDNAEDFLNNYKPVYDVVFMDIELKSYCGTMGMNGLAAAERLRKFDENVFLIFVTNMAQYALKGYAVNALDYFIKPFDYYDLKIRLDRICRVIGERKRTIVVATDGGSRVLKTEDIYYVEIFKHTLVYHTASGEFEARGSIKEQEENMREYGFARCNNSTIVNLSYCKAIQGDDLMVNDECIKISRGRKKDFISAFTKHFG